MEPAFLIHFLWLNNYLYVIYVIFMGMSQNRQSNLKSSIFNHCMRLGRSCVDGRSWRGHKLGLKKNVDKYGKLCGNNKVKSWETMEKNTKKTWRSKGLTKLTFPGPKWSVWSRGTMTGLTCIPESLVVACTQLFTSFIGTNMYLGILLTMKDVTWCTAVHFFSFPFWQRVMYSAASCNYSVRIPMAIHFREKYYCYV